MGPKVETIKFRPAGTLLFGCELEVGYDCQMPPQLVSDPKLRTTEFEKFGFVISHEYVLLAPHIRSAEPRRVSMPDCLEARHYLVTLQYRIAHRLGLGINLGINTGTFGWTFWSAERIHRFETAAICCRSPAKPESEAAGSENSEDEATSPERFREAGMMGAVALPAAFAAGKKEGSAWDQILEGATILFALCLVIVLLRLIWGLLRRRTETGCPAP